MSTTTSLEYADRLERVIDDVARRIRDLPLDTLKRSPAPGKWSIIEIIGHLVDSASNNQQRFVRARWQSDLVFAGYAQDDWVAAQRHADAPWPELVDLWRLMNRHIARIMRSTPADTRTREHSRHNLHEVAWRTVPPDQPGTLDYFMRDYVDHLEHHVRQIDGILSTSSGGN